MPRHSNSALRPLVGATAGITAGLLAAGCTQLPFRAQPPVPVPVVVEAAPEPAPWRAPTARAVEASDADAVERLVRFGEVWHAVRWFHPAVEGRAGAWDTAYLRHVHAARTAADATAFARVVNALLQELGDPETRVVADTNATMRAAVDPNRQGAGVRTTADTLLVARPVLQTSTEPRGSAPAVVPRVPHTAAVLDLRADSSSSDANSWRVRTLASDERPWPDVPLDLPDRLRLRRAGPSGVDACCTSWTLTTGARVGPMHGHRDSAFGATASGTTASGTTASGATASGATAPPVRVVIVNDRTVVPAALLALHASGRVVFVSTGSGVVHSDAAAVHIPLDGGPVARIRVEQLRLADGRPVVAQADTIVVVADRATTLLPDTTDGAVQAALAIVRAHRRTGASREGHAGGVSRASFPVRSLRDTPDTTLTPESASYPSAPERLLAVTRLWGTVRAFDPYVPMADQSWDDMYARAITDVETAASSRAYATALFRLAATLDASQVDIAVPDHPEFGKRTGFLPFRVRLVDRRPLVTFIEDSAATRSGVRVGDEILAIGGEPIDKRLGRWRELMPGSNGWSRDQRLERWLESGPALVKATFRVRGTTPEQRDVEFSYAEASAPRMMPAAERTVDSLTGGALHVRVGNRVDSRNAEATRTDDTAFVARLARAAGVIVDLRGVHTDAALTWLRGSALDADARSYARDAEAELVAPPRGALRSPELDPARQFTWSERTTSAAPRDLFTGPLAILVDATTIGDGELLALRLAAGGNTRVLVGSPTAGAVGRTASLSLPGGVEVVFPVSDVRRPDGRFIQRLGVAPDITATPTVDGVRNGRDEVREAAQRWIAQQLAPPPARRR